MYWKITADHLVDGTYITESHVGKERGEREEDTELYPLLQVKLYDDDGELYYDALADDPALEDLYEWAMYDSGVTRLSAKDPRTKKWEDVIA